MKKNRARSLLAKYAAGQCTPEETAIVESWYLRQKHDDVNDLAEKERLADMQEIRSLLISETKQGQNPVRRLWPRIAAAASVILAISFGGYFLLHKQPAQQTAQNQSDIAPGSNKAILKSHGRTYNINDAKNGLLAQQGNITISKAADSQLIYQATNGGNGKMAYDTLIIPRGGQYRLKLSDGSIAYLNADSRIRYPESFTGKERKVELISGEAYFEVVHNGKMPFRVSSNKQVVEDIGTHFNINAYADETAIKTTLAEGSVKISKGAQSVILKPAQQAINQANLSLVVQNVDVDEVTAWKEGMFRFNDAPLEDIMKQVSRWYNVDIVYQDVSLQAKRFGAITTRFARVSELLHVLEMTGKVKFEIEGRKIIVMNK